MKSLRFFGSVFSLLAAASCSVNYDTVYETEDTVPELMLDDAVLRRVKDSRAVSEIQSGRLEEFKDGSKLLARDIRFETKDRDGSPLSFGSAGLMKADTKNEIYEFYDGFHIESPKRGVRIDGESLRWNGKTEQLSGERGKAVFVQKDGITLSGKGFSASAVSESFNFASDVSGECEDGGAPGAESDGQAAGGSFRDDGASEEE